jgi:putative restriction endonuclease
MATTADPDAAMRMSAFEHVRRLAEVHDHLTATELRPCFFFNGERFPLMNRSGAFSSHNK